MSVHNPPCRSTDDHIAAVIAERDNPWLSGLLDRWRDERAEEMRLAAIQAASDQVPTEMADWPAGPPGEAVMVFGK